MTPLVLGGIAVWLATAGVLSLFSAELAATGRSWWIDCAWWGAAIGLPGLIVMTIHDKRRHRHDNRDR